MENFFMTVSIEDRFCESCKKPTSQCVSTGRREDGEKWIVTVCEKCIMASGNGLNSQLLIRLTNPGEEPLRMKPPLIGDSTRRFAGT